MDLSPLVSLLFSREPKTPMSFFTRLLWVIAITIVSVLYSNLQESSKFYFVQFALILGSAVVAVIVVLTWFKPDHLLYGAAAHLEKWKTAYGSDKGPASEHELLSPSGNPETRKGK